MYFILHFIIFYGIISRVKRQIWSAFGECAFCVLRDEGPFITTLVSPTKEARLYFYSEGKKKDEVTV